MAVHNGLPYLESTLASILTQTLDDIEVLVVDDASTDGTAAVLAGLAARDPRLRFVSLTANEGPGPARNRALALARGTYAAVMDADDIAVATRLAVQKAWLDAHPEVLLVAASNRRIDGEGKVLSSEIRALSAAQVRWRARFGMPLVHPTFMFRRFGADGGFLAYRPAAGIAEDYDFLVRTLERGPVVSLPDVLLDWRLHGTSMTATRLAEQKADAEACARRVQALDLTEAQRRDLDGFMAIVFGDRPVTLASVIASFGVFRRMICSDLARMPQRPGLGAALRQQAVTVLVYYLGTRGIGRPRVIALMALFAPDFLLAGLGERRRRQNLRRAATVA